MFQLIQTSGHKYQLNIAQLYMAQYSQSISKSQPPHSNDTQTLTRSVVSLLESEQLSCTSMYQSKFFFVALANNVQSYYETLKMIKFLITENRNEKQYKLYWNSILIIEALLQTCIVPVITTIEAFILPHLKDIAIQFVQHQKLIPKQVPHSIQMVKLREREKALAEKCVEIILIWGSVKQHQFFQYEEMNTPSLVSSLLQELVNERAVPAFSKITEINNQIRALKKGFNESLESDKNLDLENSYEKFFRNLFFLQLSSKNSQVKCSSGVIHQKIFASKSFPTPYLPDLNMDELYSLIDSSYTAPLNFYLKNSIEEFLSSNLESINETEKQNFFLKQKDVLAILSKLIRWGDLEAYLNAICNDALEMIGMKVLQIKGYKSIKQGQKIFIELGPQFLGRLQFYKEFMKFMDILGICHEKDLQAQFEIPTIREIYKTLKQRKYIFPQNIMLPKIKTDFDRAVLQNLQRNELLLYKIKHNPSVFTGNMYNSDGSISPSKLAFSFIEFVRVCEDDIYILCSEQNPVQITQLIGKIKLSINDLQLEKSMMEQEYSEELTDEYLMILDRAQFIINKFKILQPLCDKFLNHEISLRIFRDKIVSMPQPRSFHRNDFQGSPKSIHNSSNRNQVFYSSNTSNITSIQPKPFSQIPCEGTPLNLSKHSCEKSQSFSQIGNQSLMNSSQMHEQSISRRISQRNETGKSIKLCNTSEYIYSHKSMSMTAQKKKKIISQRIQKILIGLKNLVSKNLPSFSGDSDSRIFDPILTQSALEPFDKIKFPSYQPSLQSNSSKQSQQSFKQCLDIKKEMIREKQSVPKAYQKIKHSQSSSFLSSAPTFARKGYLATYETSNESDSWLKMNSVPICESNPIPDPEIGRLIDYMRYLPAQNSNTKEIVKEILNKKQRIFSNSDLQIEVSLLPIKGQKLFGTLHLSTIEPISKFQISQKSFFSKPSINLQIDLKNADYLTPGSYQLNFQAQLTKIQQSKLPAIIIKYIRTTKKICEYSIDIPITLHHFTKFSQIKTRPLIVKSNGLSSLIQTITGSSESVSVIHSDMFRYNRDKVSTEGLMSVFKQMSYLFEGREFKNQIFGVEAQVQGFVNTNCELYLDLQRGQGQRKEWKMRVYGATKQGSMHFLQALVSIFRHYFSE